VLTLRHCSSNSGSMRGFSLIELMVSMVIGLIVAAGAVSLIVAIDQSNSETIQATRLTQELRSLAGMIADDIKRTRRIDDPIAMVGQGTSVACATTPVTPAQPCYPIHTIKVSAVSTTIPSCLTYGYTGTLADESVYNYRSFRLSGNDLVLDQLTFDPNAVAAGTALPTVSATACPAVAGTTAYTLNADRVKITSFCVSSNTDTGTCFFDATTSTCTLNTTVPASNEIDLCIAAQLQAGDTYTKTITRAFVQPIRVRSGSPN